MQFSSQARPDQGLHVFRVKHGLPCVKVAVLLSAAAYPVLPADHSAINRILSEQYLYLLITRIFSYQTGYTYKSRFYYSAKYKTPETPSAVRHDDAYLAGEEAGVGKIYIA